MGATTRELTPHAADVLTDTLIDTLIDALFESYASTFNKLMACKRIRDVDPRGMPHYKNRCINLKRASKAILELDEKHLIPDEHSKYRGLMQVRLFAGMDHKEIENFFYSGPVQTDPNEHS